MSEKFRFDCGCEFNITAPAPPGGKPCLDYNSERDTNVTCVKMWELVKTGYLLGCFQIESQHSRKFCKKLQPNNIGDLTALIALVRPGLIQALDPVDNKTSMADVFCKRKNGEIPVRVDFPAIQQILADTFQVLLYQEQQIKIGELIAGFTKAEADTKLRKNIAKKSPELLFALETEFTERCKTVGLVSEEQAKKIFGWIKAASRYSFNQCLALTSLVECKQKGQIQLKDVKVGDYIQAPSVDYKNQKLTTKYVKVLNVYYQGRQDAYRVYFDSGETIDCTLNHNFLVERNQKQNINELLASRLSVRTLKDYAKISKLKYLGSIPTMDIKVDSDDHFFFCNGLATSNSHSASYSTLSAKTIFQKAHFTKAFYKAKLQSCADKTNINSATVSDYINEAKLFNISVRLPKFTDLRDTFYIKDGDISFGLRDIKGFGESTFKSISASVDSFPDKDNLKNYTWNELLIKFLIQYKIPQEGKTGTPPRLISESIVDSLIKAGAFSYFGKSRSELLAYYGLFSYLTHTDVKYLNGIMAGLDLNNTTSLFNTIGRLVKDGGIFKSQPRLAGFHDEIKSFNSKKLTDSPLWVTFCEDSLLGVPITCQKIDSYDTTEANMTLKAFITGGNSDYAVYACDIEDSQERILTKGKNAGEVWASIILSDGTAKLSVAVWPEDYKRWASLLYKGNSVIIRGERGKGKYKDNLEIKQIEQARAPATHLESINEEYGDSQLTTVEF